RGTENCRDDYRIARERVDLALPSSLVPRPADLREPDPRRPDVDPEGEQFRDAARRADPLEPLVPHSLGRELRQSLRVRLRRLERAAVDAKPEARAAAQRRQAPQTILR